MRRKRFWMACFPKASWAYVLLHLSTSPCIRFLHLSSSQIDTTESSILITEPYLNLPKIQDIYDQFVFEEYEFQSYYRCTRTHVHIHVDARSPLTWAPSFFLEAASLIPHGKLYSKPSLPTPECMLVVDSGFSFTHVVPIINGVVQWSSVKRSVQPQSRRLTHVLQYNIYAELLGCTESMLEIRKFWSSRVRCVDLERTILLRLANW